MHDTHAMFGQVEPQRKRGEEFPVMLFERTNDFALERTEGRCDVTRQLTMTEQAIFVIAAYGTPGMLADQIDRARGVGTANDEVTD